MQRAERGIAYHLKGAKVMTDVMALLHDPLTETVLTDADQFSLLFAEHQPQPLSTIDLLNPGAGSPGNSEPAAGAVPERQ